MSDKLKLKNH